MLYLRRYLSFKSTNICKVNSKIVQCKTFLFERFPDFSLKYI